LTWWSERLHRLCVTWLVRWLLWLVRLLTRQDTCWLTTGTLEFSCRDIKNHWAWHWCVNWCVNSDAGRWHDALAQAVAVHRRG